jgi:hypothetical protein
MNAKCARRSAIAYALLMTFVICGCAQPLDKDPWIRVQKCSIRNASAEPIQEVYLECLDPAWETKPIDVLAPGETKEIALPNNGIPRNFVHVNWKISDTAHMGIMHDLTGTMGHQESVLVIIDQYAKIEMTPQPK